jgi:N-carbamoylputrescine amidase
MSMLTIATTQFACSWELERNLDQAEQLVRQAAAQGAQVILLQELFATPYFCIEQDHKHLALAEEYRDSQVLKRFAALARELGVVLPLSWFEKAGNAYFNSLSVADADGRLLGVYRKTHIPNAIGYQEKEYFSPGDTGFRVWDTAFGRSAWASAGISGSRRPPAAWPCRAPRCCCSPPPSAPSRAPRRWTRVTIGRCACAAMPPPTSSR